MSFQSEFQRDPTVVSSAPGRVNLLGEHTDYSGGFVLPIGVPQTTRVELAPSSDEHFHLYSASLHQHQNFSRGQQKVPGFGRYLHGCVEILARAGYRVPPACVRVDSSVPIGVGLSSSASLEIAFLRAVRAWLRLPLSDIDLAQMAQQAEVEFAEVQCGIMDQMASSIGDEGHMLFLDTRSLNYRRLPLPEHSEVLVIDTGTPRQLAGTAYNLRREECEIAARLLGVDSLRDAHDLQAVNELPAPYRMRARHVVTENRRVLDAVGAGAEPFGRLMNESHESLRDDYEVSSTALDALVVSLQRESAVFGARLTGAGFGGACVALAKLGEGKIAADSALRHFASLGFNGGRRLV